MNKGFDVVVGNPPYGQNTAGGRLRRLLSVTWDPSALGKKSEGGSYNLSAIFVDRALGLLRCRGQLGLIVNNSIARVDEFKRTRRLLKREAQLRAIVDEGNPFENSGVTLEMITLIATRGGGGGEGVLVSSRRRGREFTGRTSPEELEEDDRFVLYRDDIYAHLRETCRFGALHGTRGRDAPRRDSPGGEFVVPYYHSGKSVHKWRTVYPKLDYAPRSVLERPSWREECDAELPVATKVTDRYRVTLKPPGLLAGNNVVKLTQEGPEMDPFALMAILNSRLLDHIVRRYLINYSELTMAFYDSITMATPLPDPSPEEEAILGQLAHYLLFLRGAEGGIRALATARYLDLLVYELYFGDGFEGGNAASGGGRRLFSALGPQIAPFDCREWLRLHIGGRGQGEGLRGEGTLAEMEAEGDRAVGVFLDALGDSQEVISSVRAIEAHPWVRRVEGR